MLRRARDEGRNRLQSADAQLASLEADLAAAQAKRQASAEAVAARQAEMLRQIEELEAADAKRREVEEMMAQVSMQEPPSSFAAFQPVPAPPQPPAAGFDATAGGFEL